MSDSPVTATVNLDRDGLQHGFLTLPHSRDNSAWGHVMTPITVVRNGEGPTVLLTGGNHGDEYEGITALLKLANRLTPAQIRGRVIILPMLNHPAVLNGTRTSPVDGGNLNRSFPGHPAGTLTEKLADYLNRYLVPRSDLVLDIHSGGHSLDLLPFAVTHRLADTAQGARCLAAARAFGAPHTLYMAELEGEVLFDSAVENQGKVFVSTELRGGGTTTPETIAIAERGIDNVLRHAGVLPGEPQTLPSQTLEIPDGEAYRVSEHGGILELTVALGDRVKKGEVIARIYDLHRTGQPPSEYRAPYDAILMGRRHPALINVGDTFAVLAVPR